MPLKTKANKYISSIKERKIHTCLCCIKTYKTNEMTNFLLRDQNLFMAFYMIDHVLKIISTLIMLRAICGEKLITHIFHFRCGEVKKLKNLL